MADPSILAPGASDDMDRVGGKARGLLHMREAGVDVPDWVVLDAKAYRRALRRASPAAREGLHLELPSLDHWEPFAERVRPRLCVPDDLAERLRERGRALLEGGGSLVVRSSAIREDRSGSSMAGVFASRTGVSVDGVPAAVEAVWRSAWTQRALAHVLERGLDPRDVAVAVVLQREIDPERSGVMVTEPGREASDEPRATVEWVDGPPEGLVSGSEDPDRVLIRGSEDASSGDLSIADTAGPHPEEIRPALEALGSRIEAIEAVTDGPADVEWVWDGDRLWIVQARPVVRPDPSSGEEDPPEGVWLSWFFNQRFDRPLTPLTRTLLVPLIEQRAILDPLRMVGYGDPETLDPTCVHRGRFYVRAEAFDAMLSLFPRELLPPDLRFVKETASQEAAGRGDDGLSLVSLLKGGLEIVASPEANPVFTLDRWTKLKARVPEELGSDLGGRSLEQLHEAIEERLAWSDAFLQVHRYSIVYADVFHALYESRFSEAYRPPAEDPTPTQRCNWLILDALQEGWDRPDEPPEPANELFEEHGHRSFGLELALPSWRMRPDLLWAFVRTFRETEDASPEAPAQRLLDRGGSTATQRPEEGSGILQRIVQRYTHDYLVAREEQRFVWEKALEGLGRVLREIGARLASEGIIEHAHDVFFLTREELETVTSEEGSAPDREEVSRRVRERRGDWYRFDLEPYPSVLAHGAAPEQAGLGEARTLEGRGVSPGQAHGKAIVVQGSLDIAEVPTGAILVTRTLDPGWTAIFTQIAGLVTTRGGMLSHGAILARENRVPCVVVPGLDLRSFPEGATVAIDGDVGEVTLFADDEAATGPGAEPTA